MFPHRLVSFLFAGLVTQTTTTGCTVTYQWLSQDYDHLSLVLRVVHRYSIRLFIADTFFALRVALWWA